MTILLIGGTGFISRHIVGILLEQGHQVTLLNRGETHSPFGGDVPLEFLKCDRHDASAMRKSLSGRSFDAVFDMVAYDGRDSSAAVDLFDGKVGHFVHCSTVSVYMVSDRNHCPIDESQWIHPPMQFLDRNPYGMEYGLKKRECEHVLWEAHAKRNFPVTCIRPTYVSGPGDPMRRDYFWIQRILDGGPLLLPGSGDIPFQQVYVEDLARLFVAALGRRESVGQAYNAASEDVQSLADYLRALGRLLKKPVHLVPMDRTAFEQLPFSTRQGEHVFPFDARWTSIFSLEKAKRDLGYTSTPFDTWMSLTIDWYRDHYHGDSAGYSERNAEIGTASEWERRIEELRMGV